MQKRIYYEKIKQRIAASVLCGMLAAILLVPHRTSWNVTEAWWGVLYPEFCCTAQEEGADGKTPGLEDGESPRVKIKFRWLHGF